jgi:restriction system protein
MPVLTLSCAKAPTSTSCNPGIGSRYWRNRKVGLREVKKLSALMHEKQASGIFLLTTGTFTKNARRFAIGRPINLIDGIQLVELLDDIKKNEPPPNASY